MNTTLVVVGFVFLAAAIIGGGLKAQGVEVPVISSISRQVLLGLAGVGAILISVLLPRNGSTASTGTSPTTVSLPSAVTITNRHDGETSCVVYLPLGNIGKMGQCGDVESPLQRIWAVRPLPGGYVQFVSAAQSGNLCLGVNDNGYVVGSWSCKDANGSDVPNAAWRLDLRPDGSYWLRNRFNESRKRAECLEAVVDMLSLNICNDGDSQHWDLRSP